MGLIEMVESKRKQEEEKRDSEFQLQGILKCEISNCTTRRMCDEHGTLVGQSCYLYGEIYGGNK